MTDALSAIRLLVLDVDGVLCMGCGTDLSLEPLRCLSAIVKATGAVVVLSSCPAAAQAKRRKVSTHGRLCTALPRTGGRTGRPASGEARG